MRKEKLNNEIEKKCIENNARFFNVRKTKGCTVEQIQGRSKDCQKEKELE